MSFIHLFFLRAYLYVKYVIMIIALIPVFLVIGLTTIALRFVSALNKLFKII